MEKTFTNVDMEAEKPIPILKLPVPLGFRIIGAFKTIVALLMAAASFGLFRLMNSDMGAFLEHIIPRLHLDPENRLVSAGAHYLLGIDRPHIEFLGIGTLFYALLYGTEGIGIYYGFHWAEYLIVATTAVLIPVEIYEIFHRFGPIKVTVFLINVAIFVYFLRQMRRERKLKQAINHPPIGK